MVPNEPEGPLADPFASTLILSRFHRLPRIASQQQEASAAIACRADWVPGKTIAGLYEVKSTLGKGGMGSVFRVRHNRWNIELAVKVPREDLLADRHVRDAFIHEARTWVALIDHPNIVTCYYVRVINDLTCVFAEYVDGGSLKDCIHEGRITDTTLALDIAIQSAWGLYHAHMHGLVHGDIKPGNILLTGTGTVKITDFGLSHICTAGDEDHPSATGFTRVYASPEQARYATISPASDIWNWGLTVLEMFCGEIRWHSGIAAAQALSSFKKNSGRNSGELPMPAQLHEVLRRCFMDDPGERWPSMDAVVDELKSIYRMVSGKAYSRPLAHEAQLRSPQLNNRALSLLDLGQIDAALEVFEKALQMDPHHIEATFNRCLVLWYNGGINEGEFVRQMREIRATHAETWIDDYLLALVYFALGCDEEAVRSLKLAEKQSGGDRAVCESLSLVEEYTGVAPETRPMLEPFVSKVVTPEEALESSSSVTRRMSRTSVMLKRNDIRRAYSELNAARKIPGYARDRRLVVLNRTFAKHGVSESLCQAWSAGLVEGSGSEVIGLQVHQNRESFTRATADGVAQVWTLPDAKFVADLPSDCDELPESIRLSSLSANSEDTCVALSPDGLVQLAATRENALEYRSVHSGKCLRRFEIEAAVRGIVINPGGELALLALENKSIIVWHIASGRRQICLTEHENEIESVAWVRGERFAVSGSSNANVRLWDLTTGKTVRKFFGHERSITSLAVGPEGTCFLSGDANGNTRVWELDWNWVFPDGEELVDKLHSCLKMFLEQKNNCFSDEDVRDFHERLTPQGLGGISEPAMQQHLVKLSSRYDAEHEKWFAARYGLGSESGN